MNIIELLTIIGLSYIVTKSSICRPFRELMTRKNKWFGELFSCPLCFGCWCGLIIYFVPDFIIPALSYFGIGGLATFLAFLILERIKIK